MNVSEQRRQLVQENMTLGSRLRPVASAPPAAASEVPVPAPDAPPAPAPVPAPPPKPKPKKAKTVKVALARMAKRPSGMKRRRRVASGKGPCAPDTVRCSAATNFKVATPDCCRQWNAQILGDVARLFDKKKIRWFIDYGTLLGYCVNGGLYWNDKDTDLGVLAEDRQKVLGLTREFTSLGYVVRYSQPHTGQRDQFRGGDRMKVCLSFRNRTNCDIFFWIPGEAPGMLDRINYISVDRHKGREFPTSWAFPVTRGTWEGIDVAVPAEPEKLAQHRYGENWRSLPAARTDGVQR